jgi:hypothetical protein
MTTTKEAGRFTITWRDARYFVSIPEYQGGEVVRAEVHDARVAELEGALEDIAAIEPVDGKASKNRGAMIHMQSIARAALGRAGQ